MILSLCYITLWYCNEFFCFHSQAMSVCSTVQAFLGDCKRLPKREANKGRTARGKVNWQLLSVLNNLSSRNQAQHVRRESVSNCIWREVSLHTRTQDCSCLCFTWDCLTISLQSQEPRPVNGSPAASPGAQSQKEKVPPCMGRKRWMICIWVWADASWCVHTLQEGAGQGADESVLGFVSVTWTWKTERCMALLGEFFCRWNCAEEYKTFQAPKLDI